MTPTLDVVLDLLADALASRLQERFNRGTKHAHYTRENLPPGATSWRSARETAAREGIDTIRVGRNVVIVAASWDARFSLTASDAVRATSADASTLKAMGLRLVEGGR